MKIKSLFMALALAGGVCVASTAANATTYLFTVSGTAVDGTFEISAPPIQVVDTGPTFGSYYAITNPTGDFAADTIVNLTPYQIYTSTSQVVDVSDFALGGSGQVDIETGSYIATSGTTGTLTISAVPEPATWSMMIMGAGLAGAGLRAARKRRANVAVA